MLTLGYLRYMYFTRIELFQNLTVVRYHDLSVCCSIVYDRDKIRCQTVAYRMPSKGMCVSEGGEGSEGGMGVSCNAWNLSLKIFSCDQQAI